MSNPDLYPAPIGPAPTAPADFAHLLTAPVYRVQVPSPDGTRAERMLTEEQINAAADRTMTIAMECDRCDAGYGSDPHEGTFSHVSQYGDRAIFAVYCPNDPNGFGPFHAAFYTLEMARTALAARKDADQ